MSEPLNKESAEDREPAPCPRCHKPFAKELKFTVSSWFQTDPGDGLSRWQECCKCGIEEQIADDDLPFSQSLSGSHILKLPPDKNGASDEYDFHTSGQHPVWATASYDTPTEMVDAMRTAAKTLGIDALSHEEEESGEDGGAELTNPASDVSPELPHATETAAIEAREATAAASTMRQPVDSDSVAPASDSKKTNGDDAQAVVPQTPELKAPESNEPSNQITAAGTKYDGTPGSTPMTPMILSQPSSELAKLSTSTSGQPAGHIENQTYMIGGRYEVDSVIGKGTFGPTYRARDVATGKLLCLKMVSTPISRHRRVVKRVLQEVEKSKTLNHPHIVAIYDSAIDKSGRPFYVMDLIEQGSLKQAIKQEGFLDVPEVLDIFLDVCEALGYAHEHGVLHRDLKPSNILLTGKEPSRRAKVGDFGIIKALPSIGSEALEMTQSTDVFADPSCMSPEQCLGRRLDVRSDIYSLGCSMYEAIIGKRLFTGPNALSVVVQHFKAAPRSFDSVMYNCDIHEDVEAVVMRMLEKSPDNRYQEINQVVEDLRLLKARKKPNYAYQKRKANRSLNPFAGKDDPNSAEKMFELVLNNKNAWNDKEGWGDEQKHQIAADIDRLAKKPQENQRRQRMHVVQHNTDDVIAEIKFEEIKRAPVSEPLASAAAADEVWMRGKKLQLPSTPDSPPEHRKQLPVDFSGPPLSKSQSEIQEIKLTRRQLAEMQEKARMLQQRQEAMHQQEQRSKAMMPVQRFEERDNKSVTLFADDEDEDDMPIVTVEQAKREIPDYLLQLSSSSSSPSIATMILFLFISVALVFMIWMILLPARPY